MTHFVRNFVALFVAINPISVLTFFVALTADCAPALKHKLSVKSVLVAFAVILFFIVVAEFIIEAMGLSLRSFQVAGGIILFLVAISLVLGTGEIGSPSARTDYDGMAIFPLAVPGICGPATMLTRRWC
jgi:multiple antibiotic resistance protein